MVVSVIGLGKAGLPLAAVIADSDIEVIGVDLDEKKCNMINSGINPIPEEPGLTNLIKIHGGKNLKATSDYKQASGCNVYVVIVPLFLNENFEPDFRALESALRNVGKILKNGDLVVVETTVPPMTTETLILNWLEQESKLKFGDFHLAYSPERIMTGYSISRLKEFPKVIGGVNKESGLRAFEFYKKFIPNIRLVSSSRVAEFTKIIEGCYRDVNIALANELFKIARNLDLDFFEARENANHDFCDIHLPSTGVGGHCIPVYPWFLIKLMEKMGKSDFKLLKTSREVNDDMINFWAWLLANECLKNKPFKNIKICIKGIAYRKGVKEIYYSRNLALAKLLKEKNFNVGVYDDLYSKNEIEKLGLKWLDPKFADIIFDTYALKLTNNIKKDKLNSNA